MANPRTAINWAEYPEPWRTIGPHFNRQCHAITAGTPSTPGSRLKNFRRAIGYTQVELGEFLNVSPWVVSRWEDGDRLPEEVTKKLKRRWPGVPL